MCKLKSAIILKDRIFMPDYDSHDRMLRELGIEDDYINATKIFVRVELSPKNGDPFIDIDEWEFNVDQDIKPDWFDTNEAKKMMKKLVKDWAKTHLFYGINGLTVSSGKNIYIKNCKHVKIANDTMVKCIDGNTLVSGISGNAKVDNISGNVIISNIYGNAKVSNICDDVIIGYISGNAKVSDIYGNAKVSYICGDAIISNIYGNATVYYIRDKAKVGYISGNVTIDNISDSVTITSICNSAHIVNMHGRVKVKSMYDNAYISNIYGNVEISNIFNCARVKTSQYLVWEEIENCKVEQSGTIIDRVHDKVIVNKDWNRSVHKIEF